MTHILWRDDVIERKSYFQRKENDNLVEREACRYMFMAIPSMLV